MGDGWCRRELATSANMTSTAFAAKTSRALLGSGSGQSVRVQPQKERAVDILALAIRADGLGNGQDVSLVESRRQGRPSVPRRPERDSLFGDGRVGSFLEVGLDEKVRIDELRGIGRFSRHRT